MDASSISVHPGPHPGVYAVVLTLPRVVGVANPHFVRFLLTPEAMGSIGTELLGAAREIVAFEESRSWALHPSAVTS